MNFRNNTYTKHVIEFLIGHKHKVYSLIFLLFFIKKVLPNVAQRLINHSKLFFKRIIIENLCENSLTMNVDCLVKDAGPLPVNLNCRDCKLIFSTHSEDDLEIATVDIPDIGVNGDIEIQMLLNTEIKSFEGFGVFGARMLNSSTFTFGLSGLVDVYVFNIFKISSLSLNKSFTLKGMEGLSCVLNELLVKKGTLEHIMMLAQVTITNPCDIGVEMGDVSFDLIYDDVKVGTCSMKDMILYPGVNEYFAQIYFCPSDMVIQKAQKLLSNFLCSKDSIVAIQGSLSSTNVKYMKVPLSSLQLKTILPGLPSGLLIKADMFLLQVNPVLMKAPSQIEIKNPFDETIKITKILGQVNLMGTVIGNIDANFNSNPITLLPRKTKITEKIYINLKISIVLLNALVQAATNQLSVDIDSSLDTFVGQYFIQIKYSQENIPVTLM